MIDIHTHILPNMDDGSDSVETSYQLLDALEKQNVKLVCLTSHFYPSNESIDDFLRRRNESFKKLNYQGNLELRLGSEVHFYRGISNTKDINKLLIEDSNILLLELPFFHEISKSIVDEIIKLNFKYDVVLAHIERYDISKSLLDYLKDNGVYFQVNADSFSSRRVQKMFKQGYVDFIGSDCHNLDSRSSHYDKAVNIVINKYGKDFLETFVEKTYKILS